MMMVMMIPIMGSMFINDKYDVNGDGYDNGDDDASDDPGPPENLDLGMQQNDLSRVMLFQA